jgi:hypothetical protein
MSDAFDFSQVPDHGIRELHRQAEVCLNGTIQLALAADQRATTMAGIFGAGSLALLAAIATVLAGNNPNVAFILAAGCVAAFLFGAALMCAWAGKPTDFHVGGFEPKRLAASASDETWMLRYATEDLQMRIDFNRRILIESARRLVRGATLAIASVPIGIAAFAVIALSGHLRSF